MAVVVAASFALRSAIRSLIELYVIILVARALLSWFPLQPGSPLVGVVRFLDRLTEPVLAPIRRILPPLRAGGMAVDLSILILIIGLQILISFI